MPGLSSEEILRAWELCASARAADRPLALLAAAGGVRSELARLPLGLRDARLLELRARTFGPVLDIALVCPACREQLELSLEVAQLADGPAALPETHVMALADGEVELRLLDSNDLSRAAALGDVDAAREYLFEASVVAVRRGDHTLTVAALADDERALVTERIAELDPRADIVLDARCPACDHVWPAPFDPASFVHAEVTTAAQRLLRQVATLARAFGWTEPEVLALSAARRSAYIELAEARIA